MPQGQSKNNEAERRVPIGSAKKEEMLAVFIRNRDAFSTVAEMFKVTDCRKAMGEHYALLWREVRKFHKKYSELPSKTQLESLLHEAVTANDKLTTDGEREELDRFLDFAWDDVSHGKKISKNKNVMRVAVDTCKEVLEELITEELAEKLQADGTLPTNINELLGTAQKKLDLTRSITEIDLGVPFPEGWDERKDNQITTTGVSALDALTGGGLMPGECLLFMAPYGSCKTVTACDSTAELILHAAQIYVTGKSRRNAKNEPLIPVVVLCFTESDKAEYRNRLMANLARVPWKKLREMTSLKDLDDSSHPGAKASTKYELEEFKDKLATDKEGFSWKNERKRVKEVMTVANKHLLLIDCTNAEDNPYKIGTGGMAELANVVRGIFRKKPMLYPIMIWVDHLSGLVDRMGEMDESVQRKILTNMPRIAVEDIGNYLRCPVGLMHQFAGAMQNKSPTAKLHHSDAEGSKSLGKYANFCVVSGKTDENLMCVWEATKHRREPPTAHRIIRVHGEFSRLIDCSKTHGIEPGRRIIISKDEMNSTKSMPTGSSKPSTFSGLLEPADSI